MTTSATEASSLATRYLHATTIEVPTPSRIIAFRQRLASAQRTGRGMETFVYKQQVRLRRRPASRELSSNETPSASVFPRVVPPTMAPVYAVQKPYPSVPTHEQLRVAGSVSDTCEWSEIRSTSHSRGFRRSFIQDVPGNETWPQHWSVDLIKTPDHSPRFLVQFVCCKS